MLHLLKYSCARISLLVGREMEVGIVDNAVDLKATVKMLNIFIVLYILWITGRVVLRLTHTTHTCSSRNWNGQANR